MHSVKIPLFTPLNNMSKFISIDFEINICICMYAFENICNYAHHIVFIAQTIPCSIKNIFLQQLTLLQDIVLQNGLSCSYAMKRQIDIPYMRCLFGISKKWEIWFGNGFTIVINGWFSFPLSRYHSLHFNIAAQFSGKFCL